LKVSKLITDYDSIFDQG